MHTWLDLHEIRTRDLIHEAQTARARRTAPRRHRTATTYVPEGQDR
ncbi:hypothetical protein [Georgenia subflava]|nr:hypothetical protein [Georgenia subflava]